MQRCAALYSVHRLFSLLFSQHFFLISSLMRPASFWRGSWISVARPGKNIGTVLSYGDPTWHTAWICLTSLFHPFPSFSSFVFLIFPIFRGTLTFWSANGSHLMVCLLPTYFLFEPTKTSNIFSRPKTASTFRGPPLFWSSPCGISPPPNLAKDEGARLS